MWNMTYFSLLPENLVESPLETNLDFNSRRGPI